MNLLGKIMQKYQIPDSLVFLFSTKCNNLLCNTLNASRLQCRFVLVTKRRYTFLTRIAENILKSKIL